MTSARWIATIGYEGATMPALLAALRAQGVAVLVDVRAVANSRRPGFSKRGLAAQLEEAEIGYRHLRALGTPAEGRAAARSGRHAEMRRIFGDHLRTKAAQSTMAELASWVCDGQRLALLCFEADPAHCHRTIVAAEVARRTAARVVALHPEPDQD